MVDPTGQNSYTIRQSGDFHDLKYENGTAMEMWDESRKVQFVFCRRSGLVKNASFPRLQVAQKGLELGGSNSAH